MVTLTRTLISLLLLCGQVCACELLVFARDNTHPDPEKDRRGSWKRGYIVAVRPDGFQWGYGERWPYFFLVRLPNVPVDLCKKYIDQQMSGEDIYRRRRWQIQVQAMPVQLGDRLADGLTIRTTVYTGTGDANWTTFRSFILNLETGLPETSNL